MLRSSGRLFFLLLLFTGCTTYSSLRKGVSHQQGEFITEVPVRINNNLLALDVYPNNSEEPLEFIFDTGASISVISRDAATRLGLKTVLNKRIGDSRGQRQRLELVVIDRLHIGCVEFRNVVAAVADYGPNSILPCVGRDGILGNNLIRLANWRYNGDSILHLSSTPWHDVDSVLVTIPLAGNARPYLTLEVNGKKVENLLLDTGSGGHLDIPVSKFNELFTDSVLSYTEIDGTSQGLFGSRTDTIHLALAERIGYGAAQWPALIEFGTLSTPKLGMKWLRNFRWEINEGQTGLRLRTLDTVRPAPEKTTFGFTPLLQDKRLIVSSVVLGSDAYESGLRLGMELRWVNGKTADDFPDLCSFVNWLGNLKDMERLTAYPAEWKDPVILKRQDLLKLGRR